MIYMFCYVSGSALLKINTEKRKQKGQMCQLAHRDKQEGNQERYSVSLREKTKTKGTSTPHHRRGT